MSLPGVVTVENTKCYEGRWPAVVVPLGLAALLSAGGMLGCLIALLPEPYAPPSPVHRFCILSGGLFFLLCAWSVVKAGLSGFFRSVEVSDQGVVAVGPLNETRFEWTQVKRVISAPTAVSVLMEDVSEIEFGPTLADFPMFAQDLWCRFEDFKKRNSP